MNPNARYRKAHAPNNVAAGEFTPRKAIPFAETRRQLAEYLHDKGDITGPLNRAQRAARLARLATQPQPIA